MRTCISLFVALIALVALGCQNSTPPSSQATAQRAVIVSGGNGGNTTTVFLPSNDPSNPVILCSSSDATVCPECKAAAIKYFSTGVLDPKCSRTGAVRVAAMGVPPNYGHN